MFSGLSGEEVTGEEEEGEVGLILGTCAALALVTAGVITGTPPDFAQLVSEFKGWC